MLGRLLTLIRKELLAQVRDRQSRRLLVLPVLLQLLVFPFAATMEVKNNALAVQNQDGGQASIELIERLGRTRAFPTLRYVYGEAQARAAIDEQRAIILLRIPEDFSRKLAAGAQAPLEAVLDGRRSNAAQVAYGYVQQVVDGFVAELGARAPATVTVRNWFNPNLDSKWFLLPSLVAVIATLGCLIVTAMSVAREREQGTFEQLLVSPLTPGLIMIGKAVPALIIAIAQASVVLAGAVLAYRIPFQGSIALLYVAIVVYGLALVGIGLFISSMCSTQQQAFLGVFGFVMPAIMLSGFISPIENIPEPLRTATWFNPVRHFLVIARGLYLKGFDAQLVWYNSWPLLVIAALTTTLAYAVFRWKSG